MAKLVTIMALHCTVIQRVLDDVISIQLVGMIVMFSFVLFFDLANACW